MSDMFTNNGKEPLVKLVKGMSYILDKSQMTWYMYMYTVSSFEQADGSDHYVAFTQVMYTCNCAHYFLVFADAWEKTKFWEVQYLKGSHLLSI